MYRKWQQTGEYRFVLCVYEEDDSYPQVIGFAEQLDANTFQGRAYGACEWMRASTWEDICAAVETTCDLLQTTRSNK